MNRNAGQARARFTARACLGISNNNSFDQISNTNYAFDDLGRATSIRDGLTTLESMTNQDHTFLGWRRTTTANRFDHKWLYYDPMGRRIAEQAEYQVAVIDPPGGAMAPMGGATTDATGGGASTQAINGDPVPTYRTLFQYAGCMKVGDRNHFVATGLLGSGTGRRDPSINSRPLAHVAPHRTSALLSLKFNKACTISPDSTSLPRSGLTSTAVSRLIGLVRPGPLRGGAKPDQLTRSSPKRSNSVWYGLASGPDQTDRHASNWSIRSGTAGSLKGGC